MKINNIPRSLQEIDYENLLPIDEPFIDLDYFINTYQSPEKPNFNESEFNGYAVAASRWCDDLMQNSITILGVFLKENDSTYLVDRYYAVNTSTGVEHIFTTEALAIEWIESQTYPEDWSVQTRKEETVYRHQVKTATAQLVDYWKAEGFNELFSKVEQIRTSAGGSMEQKRVQVQTKMWEQTPEHIKATLNGSGLKELMNFLNPSFTQAAYLKVIDYRNSNELNDSNVLGTTTMDALNWLKDNNTTEDTSKLAVANKDEESLSGLSDFQNEVNIENKVFSGSVENRLGLIEYVISREPFPMRARKTPIQTIQTNTEEVLTFENLKLDTYDAWNPLTNEFTIPEEMDGTTITVHNIITYVGQNNPNESGELRLYVNGVELIHWEILADRDEPQTLNFESEPYSVSPVGELQVGDVLQMRVFSDIGDELTIFGDNDNEPTIFFLEVQGGTGNSYTTTDKVFTEDSTEFIDGTVLNTIIDNQHKTFNTVNQEAGSAGIDFSVSGHMVLKDVNGAHAVVPLPTSVEFYDRKLTGVSTPTENTDATTKLYVDTGIRGYDSTNQELGVATFGFNTGGDPQILDQNGVLAFSITTNSISANNRRVINVAQPTNDNDAATKLYVDENSGGDGFDSTNQELASGGFGFGFDGTPRILSPNGSVVVSFFDDDIVLYNKVLTGLAQPTNDTDAANKAYVDANSGGGGGIDETVLLYDEDGVTTGSKVLSEPWTNFQQLVITSKSISSVGRPHRGNKIILTSQIEIQDDSNANYLFGLNTAGTVSYYTSGGFRNEEAIHIYNDHNDCKVIKVVGIGRKV